MLNCISPLILTGESHVFLELLKLRCDRPFLLLLMQIYPTSFPCTLGLCLSSSYIASATMGATLDIRIKSESVFPTAFGPNLSAFFTRLRCNHSYGLFHFGNFAVFQHIVVTIESDMDWDWETNPSGYKVLLPLRSISILWMSALEIGGFQYHFNLKRKFRYIYLV